MSDVTATEAQRYAFVDLEASSLGSGSFPTEIGWATIQEGQIRSGACLITPTAKWLRSSTAWNPASQRLTGITKEMLDRQGVSPSEAMRRFLAAVDNRLTLSDEPEFDSFWLGQLAEAADADPIKLGDAKAVINEASRDGRDFAKIGAEFPVRHRAEPDARRLAMIYARAAGIHVTE
jgi:DNA polymerase III epsilon subunit-like protein